MFYPETTMYYVLSYFSCVQLSLTPWAVVCQAPLSMGFYRQEYQAGLPWPPPGDLPNPRIKPTSLTSSASAGWFFATSTTREAPLTATLPSKVSSDG